MDQMPNMKDLEYFCEIARTCSLTQTARLFGVSQPTVSYALKRLEAQVGSRLVARSTSHHGLALTPSDCCSMTGRLPFLSNIAEPNVTSK
jgi:DNA-binding CsgD family transcriptional regulator